MNNPNSIEHIQRNVSSAEKQLNLIEEELEFVPGFEIEGKLFIVCKRLIDNSKIMSNHIRLLHKRIDQLTERKNND